MESGQTPLLQRIGKGLSRLFNQKNTDMANDSKPDKAKKEKADEAAVATEEAPVVTASRGPGGGGLTMDTPAQTAIHDYLNELKKIAAENIATANKAVTDAEIISRDKQAHFNRAEEAVDAYEAILTCANPLANNMTVAASEVDRSIALAAEVAKALTQATAGIQQSKNQLAAADNAAAALWDAIRRDLSEDEFVKILRGKIPELNTRVEAYAQKTELASDDMNKALAAINALKVELKTDDLKKFSQDAKTKCDAYQKEQLANLEFAKDSLKKLHTEWIAAATAKNKAAADLEIATVSHGSITDLESLKQL
jgi:hypothetical protein